MTPRVPLSAVLDEAERSEKLTLRTQDIRAELPDLSPAALRQTLHRQQRRGRLVRLSRGFRSLAHRAAAACGGWRASAGDLAGPLHEQDAGRPLLRHIVERG